MTWKERFRKTEFFSLEKRGLRGDFQGVER